MLVRLLLLSATAHAIAVNGRQGEVVGARGRIGSLLLRAGGGSLAATPRGVAPGALSPPGTPILVAAPASAVADVLRATPPSRLEDVVLLCNGDARGRATEVVGAEADGLTYGCLFFGVLSTGAAPTFGAGAPPTVVTGRHAAAVAALIGSCGPRCDVVDRDALLKAVRLKLVWSAALWLICARHGGDVVDAHAEPDLELLVDELDPAVDRAALEAYSRSMPGAVPSKDLALAELADRNGMFLRSGRPQPTHERLLREVGVDPAEVMTTAPAPSQWWRHAASGFGFRARRAARAAPRSAVVVGAGVMGSAVALELATRGVAVTVLDSRPAPATALRGAVVCEDATSGSWAWLNANGKDAKSPEYGGLTRTSLAMWRRQEPYAGLATWCGALLYADGEPQTAGGAYAVDELTAEEAAAREPGLKSKEGRWHLYPDEGRADPAATVATLQKAAEAAGATFRWGATVDGLLPGGEGVRVDGADVHADAVVLAAGVGIPALGAPVPMKRSPGVLAHTQPKTGGTTRMRGLVVDAVSGVHFLQRNDGTAVVGGDLKGYAVASSSSMEDAAPSLDEGARLVDRAAAWLPHVAAPVQATTLAYRVLPEDGYPAVGFTQAGSYVCAAHSAITLAPVLSALAVAELLDGVDVDVLEPWRPGRFC